MPSLYSTRGTWRKCPRTGRTKILIQRHLKGNVRSDWPDFSSFMHSHTTDAQMLHTHRATNVLWQKGSKIRALCPSGSNLWCFAVTLQPRKDSLKYFKSVSHRIILWCAVSSIFITISMFKVLRFKVTSLYYKHPYKELLQSLYFFYTPKNYLVSQLSYNLKSYKYDLTGSRAYDLHSISMNLDIYNYVINGGLSNSSKAYNTEFKRPPKHYSCIKKCRHISVKANENYIKMKPSARPLQAVSIWWKRFATFSTIPSVNFSFANGCSCRSETWYLL